MYKVRYHAGPYSGTREVNADDEDHAIEIVRAMIRREMTLPMYYESYRIADDDEQRYSDDDEDD